MKRRDKFTTEPYNIQDILYQIILKEIDGRKEMKINNLSYRKMKRTLKLFKRVHREFDIICQLTGEVLYSHYESFRIFDDKRFKKKHYKFLKKAEPTMTNE